MKLCLCLLQGLSEKCHKKHMKIVDQKTLKKKNRQKEEAATFYATFWCIFMGTKRQRSSSKQRAVATKLQGRLFIEQQKDWGNGFPRAYLEIAGTEREEEKKKESVRNVCGKGKSRNKARATRNR